MAAQVVAAKQAAAAAAREAALAQQRIAAAASLRTIESRVDDAEDLLGQASAAQDSAEAAVRRRAADLGTLLPVALRLARYPAETLLAAPASPDAALEGLLATHGIAAEIARQVAELRAEQAEAARLKTEVTRRRNTLNAARARQGQLASALDQQLAATKQQEAAAAGAAADASAAAADLAAKANDLRSAIAAMDQAERAAAAQAAADAARAKKQKHEQAEKDASARAAVLTRPAGPGLNISMPKATLVAGRIVRAWGAPAEDGPATGITFATAPAAFVSSPCSGRIGFAAPFRSYGKLVIIECGGGYDFVLAGFDQMAVPVGHAVHVGEPLGRMPDFAAGHGKDRPGLYVELRKGGQAVDPMPYLNGKG